MQCQGTATLTTIDTVLQVYKAMLKGVNPVAVKVLRDQSYTSRDEFGKEVGLLKTLHNSNIVQFQVRCPCASLAISVHTHHTLTVASCHTRAACGSWPANAATHCICLALQGACVEEDKMLLITEFMDGAHLVSVLRRLSTMTKQPCS